MSAQPPPPPPPAAADPLVMPSDHSAAATAFVGALVALFVVANARLPLVAAQILRWRVRLNNTAQATTTTTDLARDDCCSVGIVENSDFAACSCVDDSGSAPTLSPQSSTQPTESTNVGRTAPHSPLAVLLHKLSLITIPSYPQPVTIPTILSFLSLVLLIFIFCIGTGMDMSYDGGYTRFAFLALGCFAVSMCLSLRNSPLDLILRVPFERSLVWHRWTGVATVVLIAFHGGLYLREWVHYKYVSENLEERPRVVYGLAAAAILGLLFVSSLPPIRRLSYTAFHTIHVLCVPSVLVLVNYHTPYALPYTVIPLAFYVLDKSLRFIKSRRNVKTVAVRACPDGVTRLRLCAPPLCGPRGFRPGQYIFLNVPEVSTTSWHPVSLACAAPKTGPRGSCCGCGITLMVRGVGAFSRGLHAAARRREGLRGKDIVPITVRVEGPYGRAHGGAAVGGALWPAVWADPSAPLVLFAGGIGVTPIISLMMDRLRKVRSSSATAPGRVICVWAIRHPSHFEWLGAEMTAALDMGAEVRVYITRGGDELDIASSESSTAGSDEVVNDKNDNLESSAVEDFSAVQLYEEKKGEEGDDEDDDEDEASQLIPTPTLCDARLNKNLTLCPGRPNVKDILMDLRRDALARGTKDALVAVCGPKAMMVAVRSAARTASGADCLFHVHTETFEL